MKTIWHVTVVGGFLLMATALAQYTIDWQTVDGGGGTSTGSVYAVQGTMGQYDTGAMSGGGFSLTGGFWAIYAVQVEGAPFLSIEVSGPAEVTISWLPDDSGWILMEAPSLDPAAWTNSPSMSTNPVVVPVTQPTTFYRLQSL
jgi:hypothetical protein